MATLSLTLIVKNEEIHIPRVLAQARAFADEVVLVDTGSTDRTKEEAYRFTDRVLDFAWCDDLSKARNFGIDNCRMDYVIWLDADDEVDERSGRRIRQIMEASKNWDVLMMPYHYARDQCGLTRLVQLRERIFDRSMGFAFEYPVHECLKYPEGARVGHAMDIVIVHKNMQRREPSHVRNLRILKKAVESDTYRRSFRMWWLLAREEGGENAVLLYQKVLDEFASRPGFSPILHARIWYELGQRLVVLRRWDEALAAFGNSMALYPLWREPFFASGKVLHQQGRRREALGMFQIAGRIPPPATTELISYDPGIYDGEEFYEWLFLTYHELGDLQNAKSAVANGVRANPLSAAFQRRCAEFGVHPPMIIPPTDLDDE